MQLFRKSKQACRLCILVNGLAVQHYIYTRIPYTDNSYQKVRIVRGMVMMHASRSTSRRDLIALAIPSVLHARLFGACYLSGPAQNPRNYDHAQTSSRHPRHRPRLRRGLARSVPKVTFEHKFCRSSGSFDRLLWRGEFAERHLARRLCCGGRNPAHAENARQVPDQSVVLRARPHARLVPEGVCSDPRCGSRVWLTR